MCRGEAIRQASQGGGPHQLHTAASMPGQESRSPGTLRDTTSLQLPFKDNRSFGPLP